MLFRSYAGVNPATGRPMWYDENGNLTYLTTAKDNKIVGDGTSKYFGGINTSFSYGNSSFGKISVEGFLQGDFGRTSFDGALSFASENGGRTFNSLKENFSQRWTTPGQVTAFPRPYLGNNELRGSGQTTGDRFVTDRKSTRLNSSHRNTSRMPSSA